MDDLAARLADQTSWTLFLAGVIGMIALVLALWPLEQKARAEPSCPIHKCARNRCPPESHE